MYLVEKIRQFKKNLSSHKPLIEVFVYKNNLLHNLSQYQKNYSYLQFAPVLKANAYGHGLEQVLTVLKDQKLPFVCVDSHFELRVAEKFAPKLQALVIGFARLESILKSNSSKASFTIISFDQLLELSEKLSKPRKFHLKLDTGMNRQGILPGEYSGAIKLIQLNKNIILEGLCSHLADPEMEAETLKQIEVWNSVVQYFKEAFPQIKFFHLSATGGVRYSKQIDANLVRLGIGFYGINEHHQSELNLKPALEMRSIISGVKTIPLGEKVGYGFTFTASQITKLATVPVGYFEGVDRRLSNVGYFKINQEFYPLVGRVSMDISTVDVSQNKSVAFGDEVIVISREQNYKNSVSNIASFCQTIPYDILVHIPQHLKRIVI